MRFQSPLSTFSYKLPFRSETSITSTMSDWVKHNWASTRENLSLVFANNTGADQPAHLRSLISAFVIRVL